MPFSSVAISFISPKLSGTRVTTQFFSSSTTWAHIEVCGIIAMFSIADKGFLRSNNSSAKKTSDTCEVEIILSLPSSDKLLFLIEPKFLMDIVLIIIVFLSKFAFLQSNRYDVAFFLDFLNIYGTKYLFLCECACNFFKKFAVKRKNFLGFFGKVFDFLRDRFFLVCF